MVLTLQELTHWLHRSWRLMQRWTRQQLLQFRAKYIKELNKEEDSALYLWPASMRRLFFKLTPPHTDRETFCLSLFYIGNGLSPYGCGLWLLSAMALSSPRQGRQERLIARRMIQFLWIQRNAERNVGVWTFHSLHSGQHELLQSTSSESSSDSSDSQERQQDT